MTPRQRPGGKRFRRVIAALASLLAALLVGELLVRHFVPSLGSRSFVDLSLGWSTREYSSFDPLRDVGRLGVPRILVFGDSYLSDGYKQGGVDCRFPAAFQRSVDSRVQTGVLASSGWGTDQELLAFVEKGKAWKPDVVVVAFCANNDLCDILSNNHGARADKPYFLLEDGALALRDPFGRPRGLSGATAPAPRFQSYLYDLARIRLGQSAEASDSRFAAVDPRYLMRRAERDPTEAGVFWQEEQPVLDACPQREPNLVSAFIDEELALNSYQWELFEAIVAEFDRQVEEIDARLVLMIVPVTLMPRRTDMLVGSDFTRRFETPEGPFTVRTRVPIERLHAISERLGVPLFDPTAAFRERVVSEGLEEECWPAVGDRHFSCVGHAILAELFGDFLATELGVDVR